MRYELPETARESGEAIIYIVQADEKTGDRHSIETTDGLRAVEHHDHLARTIGPVVGNDAFETLIRPNIDLIREHLKSSRVPN